MSAVELVTMGCRLNGVDSEAIRAAFVADPGAPPVVVVNTCSVTAESVRQARQTIRRIAREQPQARIVVTGCAAQTEPQTFAAMEAVWRVVGNAAKQDARRWSVAALADAPRTITDGLAAPSLLRPHASRAGTRAFVAIQTGCDHSCTFCIIPTGRGPARSASAEAIVAQVRAMAEAGHHEVVLTGVDLTSWGGDLPETPTLGMLVRAILRAAPDLARLRLSSIDCIEADPALRDALAEDPRLMPHLHLSLQAGDDLVLKRMKRRHLRADAVRFCAELRGARPDIVFGADLITGFPTETEAMFQRSLDLVADCGLTHLHVFPFSPREGTPAARMPQVARAIAVERAARLRAAGAQALAAHLAAQVGRRIQVLTEKGGRGRAADFTGVHTPGRAAGMLLEAEVTGVSGEALTIASGAIDPAAAG